MILKVKSYFFFLLNSYLTSKQNSSFIIEFIKKSFRTQPKKKLIKKIIDYKQQLLKKPNSIDVIDFGAGSSIFSSNNRRVSKIARVAGISTKRAKLLLSLTNNLQPKNVLEIGTSLGIATSALSLGYKSSKITTLEGCPETAKIAQQQFNEFDLNNINLIIGSFKNTLPKTIENTSYDLIYFDGNHQKEATLEYFNLCLRTINNNSVFIFDDIYWSKEMQEAWKNIKQHPKVTSTIDTFQWGIVFFRKELEKKHYTIRV